MNIENFEKRAQSEFDQFLPEVDTEQIWENIEPHLKKKKRRLFILFFWGAGLGLLLLSVWKWNTPTHTFQSRNAEADQMAVRTPAPAPAQGRTEKQAISASPAKSRDKQTTRSLVSGRTVSPKNSVVQKMAPAQSSIAARKIMAENTAFQSSLPIAMVTTEVTHADIAQMEHKSQIEQGDGISVNTYPDTMSVDQQRVALANNPPTPESNPGEKSALSNRVSPKDASPRSDKKNPVKAKKPGKIKPHKRKSSDQTLAVRTGIALPLGVLKPNEQVEPNPTLLANRKSSEKSLEALTADLRYAYATRQGLLFVTGLDYTRINEKFKLSYTEKETKTITGVLTQTVDAAGLVVAQTTGPKEVTTTRIYSNIAYNQYQYLNLPIGMGYQRHLKKSQWEITGGLDVSLWFHFQGTHYNAYGTPVILGDPWSAGVYKRNAGMGLWASYGYSRNLSRNIRWQISAKANMPIGHITSVEYPLIQKYFTVGLQGGLIFNLIDAPKSKHKKRK